MEQAKAKQHPKDLNLHAFKLDTLKTRTLEYFRG